MTQAHPCKICAATWVVNMTPRQKKSFCENHQLRSSFRLFVAQAWIYLFYSLLCQLRLLFACRSCHDDAGTQVTLNARSHLKCNSNCIFFNLIIYEATVQKHTPPSLLFVLHLFYLKIQSSRSFRWNEIKDIHMVLFFFLFVSHLAIRCAVDWIFLEHHIRERFLRADDSHFTCEQFKWGRETFSTRFEHRMKAENS